MKTALRVLSGFVLLLVLTCPAQALGLAEFQARFAELRSDGAAPEAISELAAQGLAAAGDDANLKSAALTAKGYALYEQGDYEAARPVLEEAVAGNGENTLALVALSNIAMLNEDFAKADSFLTQVMDYLEQGELRTGIVRRTVRYRGFMDATSAEELWAEFDTNPYAVGSKYAGGIYVYGTISEISPDVNGNPRIIFQIGDNYFNRVFCVFSQEQISKLATVRKGEQALLYGNISPKYPGEIIVKNAEVESVLPFPPLDLKDIQ